LQDYQGDNPSIPLKEILENISSLDMKVDDVIAAIKKIAEESKKSLAQKYARMNWIAQMITSITIGAINIWANVEKDTEDRENLLTPKNILNIALVPVCMLVWQCWWHYRTTKNLQEMAEKTENLERTLSQASKSLVFRAYEFRLFMQYREKTEVAWDRCQEEFNQMQSKLLAYEERLSSINEELNRARDTHDRHRQDELNKKQAEIQSIRDDLRLQLNQQEKTSEVLKTKSRSLEENIAKMKTQIESGTGKIHELMYTPLESQEIKR